MDALMNVEVMETDTQTPAIRLPLNDVDILDNITQKNLIPIDESDLDRQLRRLADTPKICSLAYNHVSKRLTLDCRKERNLHVEHNFENLEIEKVIVNCPFFDARHAEFIRNLSFKELHFNEFQNTEWIRSNAVKHGEQYKINSNVLRQVLNQENGQQLEHLTINGKTLRLEECWSMNVTFIVNNLTFLSIPFFNLSNAQFQEMCACFTGLTYLNISDSKLRSLKGISRLTELKGLVFHNSDIETHEGISELRLLSNLTMLDVSASIGSRSTFVELFAESEMTLPALQSFLCTRNSISAYYINQILSRNRTLKNMGLLDIANIDSFSVLPNRYKNVRFFSTENLSQCMDSYIFFKMFSTTTSEEVLHKLLAFLEYNYEEQTNANTHRCLQILITELRENPESSFYSPAVIKGLYFLTWNIEPNAITEDCKNTIIRSCLHIIKSNYALKEACDYAWMVLKPDFFAGSPIDLISEICLLAAISGGKDKNKLMCFQYVDILNSYIYEVSPDKLLKIYDNECLRDVLMEQLQEGYYFQNPRDLIPLIKLIAKLTVGTTFYQPHKFVITAQLLMRKFCQLNGFDVRHVYQIPEVTRQKFMDATNGEVQLVVLQCIAYMMPRVISTQTYRTGCCFTERYSSFVVYIMGTVLPTLSVNNRSIIAKMLAIFIYFHYISGCSFTHILEEDLCLFVDAFDKFVEDYAVNRQLERYAVLNEQIFLHGEKLPENSWIIVVNNHFDAWKNEIDDNRHRENHDL